MHFLSRDYFTPHQVHICDTVITYIGLLMYLLAPIFVFNYTVELHIPLCFINTVTFMQFITILAS